MVVVHWAIFALVGLNMFLSTVIVIWDIYFFYKMKGIEQERWAKLLYAFVGFLWWIRYLLFFLNASPFGYSDPFNAGLIMLGSLTLLCLAVGSIIRVQRLGGFPLMQTDAVLVAKKIKWIFRHS